MSNTWTEPEVAVNKAAILGGSAALICIYKITASGGTVLGGSDFVVEPTRGSGGLVLGGSAFVVEPTRGSGGLVLGGISYMLYTSNPTVISEKYRQSYYGLPNHRLQRIIFVYKPRSIEGYVNALSKVS